MSMRNPDLESEFREESEFRAKVYRMLTLGLSTVEIEDLLGCKIDWSLFSQDTLEKMMAKECSKIYISLPEEYFSNVEELKNTVNTQNEYFCQSIRACADFSKRSLQTLRELKESVLNIIAGFCAVFGLILIALFGIIISIIK